jgi:flavin-dependent dehydrogenase
MNIYDCAIVGGGLAGLSLSILMAKAGFKTVLIEKETFPFHRVCGEYISFESWPFLTEEIQLPLESLHLPQIHKLNITTCKGKVLKSYLDMGGFGISRYTLDYLLAQKAMQVGVFLKTNTRVENITQNEEQIFELYTQKSETIYSRTVVGSYGKRSNLDVKWQRAFIRKPKPYYENYVGIKYHIQADLPADLIELHNFPGGYCGISKVDGDNRYCICYLTKASQLRKVGNKITALEAQILAQNPFLKTYFTNYTKLFTAPLTISQVSFAPKELIINNIPMTGDAAGLIAPLCGNGMSIALHSAKILANTLISHLETKMSYADTLINYQKQWKKQFANRLWIGRLLQGLFGGKQTTEWVIGTLTYMPGVVKTIIRATHGKPF